MRPGVTTAELDALAADVFAAHGARSAPALVYGFPGTVLISVNDEVVHGIPGARRIERGDVVKLDVTVERAGYMADAARTVVVEGAAAEARRLAGCAERAFVAALEVATAGCKVREIGRAVERTVRGEGFTVIRGLTGHGIGRTIHEPPSVPNHFDPWQQDVLTEGLVLTIEPIICAGREGGDAGRRRLDHPHPRRQPGRAPRAHARRHARPAGAPDGRLNRGAGRPDPRARRSEGA